MNYYSILNFKREPFSNSPEPEFLFQLPQYSDCLQKLELAVRLRRGINVVIGDIGTGKTTLCRKLIQNFSSTATDHQVIETHLLLDPTFKSSLEFLRTFASMLEIQDSQGADQTEWNLKEKIKNCLFDKGVDEKKIIVLIIDEGQKIPEDCLEILREFLNYETNNFKLLQIIIFAQKEFHDILKRKVNLLDRVNLSYHLEPLNFNQMRAMIHYRLRVAGHPEKAPSLFSFWGFVAIYLHTRGYPRKVVFLCHQIILKMIIRGKKTAGWFFVRSCIHEKEKPLFRKLTWALSGILLVALAGMAVSSISLKKMNAGANQPLQEIHAQPASVAVKQAESMEQEEQSVPDEPGEMPDLVMPDQIGKLSITPRRTIWWTLYNIYGDNTDPRIINRVIAANPRLKNKDHVTVGTILTLPAIPADVPPVRNGDIIIVLESGQDLEKMYNIFRNNPHERLLPPLAFLAFWHKKKGLEFNVVIDKRFPDIPSARAVVDQLPGEIGSRVKIVSTWDEDTVFFNRRALQY
jgi:general secretion pathway protein A